MGLNPTFSPSQSSPEIWDKRPLYVLAQPWGGSRSMRPGSVSLSLVTSKDHPPSRSEPCRVSVLEVHHAVPILWAVALPWV